MTRRLGVAAGVMAMAIATPFALGAQPSVSAAISGHVTDATSAPVSNYTVVVFPTDRTMWSVTPRLLRLAGPAEDGSFEVSSLPPGEYWVAATDPMNGTDASGDWQALDGLDSLVPGAARVTLKDGEARTITLPLTRR